MMSSNNRGVALILALWVLAALIVLAAGLGFMSRTEAQIARNYSDSIRCRWVARAGVKRALAEVTKRAASGPTYLGEDGLTLSSEEDGVDLGEAAYQVELQDEAGKIDINTAPPAVIEAVFGSRDVADCVVDWRDKDDAPRPLGAESEYYQGLQTPYRCKNGPFDTVNELLLVKGVTGKMLASPVDERGRKLSDILTVYSREKNETADGKARLNIQTATKEQIKAQFGALLSDGEIDAIIKQRDQKRFSKAADTIQVPGVARDKIKAIYDRITVSDKKMFAGRLNINTASYVALAAIPGIDEGIAKEIVSYRSSKGGFADVGGILEVDGLSDKAFSKCADLLTTRSGVFTIKANGLLASGKSVRSVVCVADAVDGQTQVKYWRE